MPSHGISNSVCRSKNLNTPIQLAMSLYKQAAFVLSIPDHKHMHVAHAITVISMSAMIIIA